MTEKERMQRRAELRKQVYGNRPPRAVREEKVGYMEGRKGLFWFRVYVMMIVCGGVLLLSFFHTETSERVTGKIKEVIAQELPEEMIEQMKTKITVFCEQNQIELPHHKQETKKEDTPAP